MPCDVVLNGITGSVGLQPTLAALDAGTTLALANKESLIIGGPLVTRRAKPGQIVPVDSEHCALAQCLRGGSADEVRKLVLTASGGPFRGRTRGRAGRRDAPSRRWPTRPWAMGPVVTINSATLVNKGLEVIEAHLLFGIPMDRIEVVVHPQSVDPLDGRVLRRLDASRRSSPPDMRLPIALGLGWPDRMPDAAPPWTGPRRSTWQFEPLDHEAFPAVQLGPRGRDAAAGPRRRCSTPPTRSASQAFRDGRLPFLAIVDTVARVVTEHDVPSYEDTVHRRRTRRGRLGARPGP